jgi:hypothetical protein
LILAGFKYNPFVQNSHFSSMLNTALSSPLPENLIEVHSSAASQVGTNFIYWSGVADDTALLPLLPSMLAETAELEDTFIERLSQNSLGFMPIDALASITKVAHLGNDLIVYTENGIYICAYNTDLGVGYGCKKISNVVTAGAFTIATGEFRHLFLSNHKLYQVQNGTVTCLDYGDYLTGDWWYESILTCKYPTKDYAVQQDDLFCIVLAGGTSYATYMLLGNSFWISPSIAIPRTLVNMKNTQLDIERLHHISYTEIYTNRSIVQIRTTPLAFAASGLKSIMQITLNGTINPTITVQCIIAFKPTVGAAWVNSALQTFNPYLTCETRFEGIEFKLVLIFTDTTDLLDVPNEIELDSININYQLVDRRFRRDAPNISAA